VAVDQVLRDGLVAPANIEHLQQQVSSSAGTAWAGFIPNMYAEQSVLELVG